MCTKLTSGSFTLLHDAEDLSSAQGAICAARTRAFYLALLPSELLGVAHAGSFPCLKEVRAKTLLGRQEHPLLRMGPESSAFFGDYSPRDIGGPASRWPEVP